VLVFFGSDETLLIHMRGYRSDHQCRVRYPRSALSIFGLNTSPSGAGFVLATRALAKGNLDVKERVHTSGADGLLISPAAGDISGFSSGRYSYSPTGEKEECQFVAANQARCQWRKGSILRDRYGVLASTIVRSGRGGRHPSKGRELYMVDSIPEFANS
jgi:hypothetical protein